MSWWKVSDYPKGSSANPVSFQTQPSSSPESQVEYMQAVLRAKQYEIDTLTNKLDALILERALEQKQHEDAVKALRWAQEQAWKGNLPKKKPWWRFWRRGA